MEALPFYPCWAAVSHSFCKPAILDKACRQHAVPWTMAETTRLLSERLAPKHVRPRHAANLQGIRQLLASLRNAHSPVSELPASQSSPMALIFTPLLLSQSCTQVAGRS